MATLRYLDVCLVLATAPFVLTAGLPLLGYVVGALRLAADACRRRAMQGRPLRAGTPRSEPDCRWGA